MTYTIKTNNVPRWTLQFFQLDDKDRQIVKKQFDYCTQEELEEQLFFKYRGEWYSLSNFLRVDNNGELKDWNGIYSHSAFGGILIKIVEGFMGDYDVIVGSFCC